MTDRCPSYRFWSELPGGAQVPAHALCLGPAPTTSRSSVVLGLPKATELLEPPKILVSKLTRDHYRTVIKTSETEFELCLFNSVHYIGAVTSSSEFG